LFITSLLYLPSLVQTLLASNHGNTRLHVECPAQPGLETREIDMYMLGFYFAAGVIWHHLWQLTVGCKQNVGKAIKCGAALFIVLRGTEGHGYAGSGGRTLYLYSPLFLGKKLCYIW